MFVVVAVVDVVFEGDPLDGRFPVSVMFFSKVGVIDGCIGDASFNALRDASP